MRKKETLRTLRPCAGFNHVWSKKRNRADRRKANATLSILDIVNIDFLELPLQHKRSALWEYH